MSLVTTMSASRNSASPLKSHSQGTRNRENVNSVSPRRLIGSVLSDSAVTATGLLACLTMLSARTLYAMGCRGSWPMKTLSIL